MCNYQAAFCARLKNLFEVHMLSVESAAVHTPTQPLYTPLFFPYKTPAVGWVTVCVDGRQEYEAQSR